MRRLTVLAFLLVPITAEWWALRDTTAPRAVDATQPETVLEGSRLRPRAYAPIPRTTARPRDRVRRRDPLPRIFTGATHMALVRVGAVLDTAVGEALLECLPTDLLRSLQHFSGKTGVDLTRAIDQVAAENKTVVFTGDFSDARWSDLLGVEPRPYGDDAVLYEVPRHVDSSEPVLGVWRRRVQVLGDDVESVTAALDRLSGDDDEPPRPPPPVPPGHVASVKVPAQAFLSALLPSLRQGLEGVDLWITAQVDDELRLHFELLGDDEDQLAAIEENLQGLLESPLPRLASVFGDHRGGLVGLLASARIEDGHLQLRADTSLLTRIMDCEPKL